MLGRVGDDWVKGPVIWDGTKETAVGSVKGKARREVVAIAPEGVTPQATGLPVAVSANGEASHSNGESLLPGEKTAPVPVEEPAAETTIETQAPPQYQTVGEPAAETKVEAQTPTQNQAVEVAPAQAPLTEVKNETKNDASAVNGIPYVNYLPKSSTTSATDSKIARTGLNATASSPALPQAYKPEAATTTSLTEPATDRLPVANGSAGSPHAVQMAHHEKPQQQANGELPTPGIPDQVFMTPMESPSDLKKGLQNGILG